ncbi:glycosyltransferase family 2 protein [Chloroflexus sp.]|uniref:glycosyltransferase family 2 protein n=1 Tax=Chloroflexus sp. TaxID=1904827 RepID=UPI00404B00CB
MSLPTISVVICTSDRGGTVADTVASILANDHPAFEVFVIDQSGDAGTAHTLQQFHHDRRFHYLPVRFKGWAKGHNLGLRIARSPLLAITDDDCVVPPDWLRILETELRAEPRTAVLYCNVLPGPHDPSAGFVPGFQCTRRVVVNNLREKWYVRGIGAGMAIHRERILAIGGFDERLGPGSTFGSAADVDIAIRAILAGWSVVGTPATSVIHYGFRTWEEGRRLTARNWEGLGAAFIKPVKAGYHEAGVLFWYELKPVLLEPLLPLLRVQRPHGLGRFVAFTRGCLRGLLYQVDRKRLVYL